MTNENSADMTRRRHRHLVRKASSGGADGLKMRKPRGPIRQLVRFGMARARIRPEVEMPTLTVEKELLELENQYWQAIKERDVDTAMQLTEFPCLIAGATGIGRVDKEAFVKMMK